MKNTCYILFSILILTACGNRIPLQANTSNQSLQSIIDKQNLMTIYDKELKADYKLSTSFQADKIDLVQITKNGSKTVKEDAFEYASDKALKTFFNEYFDNKFNEFSDDVMSINIEMNDLYLEKKFSTSTGATILTGNSNYSMNAIGSFEVQITYKQKDYNKEFEVAASDYNEFESFSAYSFIQKNSTEQNSLILQACFNRAIIKTDNVISNVLEVAY